MNLLQADHGTEANIGSRITPPTTTKAVENKKRTCRLQTAAKMRQTRLCTFAPDTYENCNGEALGDDESLAKHPAQCDSHSAPARPVIEQ